MAKLTPKPGQAQEVAAKIDRSAQRKSRARRAGHKNVWFGLGMFGLVGWSIAVPTLLGTALGVWLDRRFPGEVSWTLTLLFGGILLGCLNAWYWVKKESRHH